MPRRLNPDEKALWAKVVESVRPLHSPTPESEPVTGKAAIEVKTAARRPGPKPGPQPPPLRSPPRPGSTLDGTWDRRLARGLVQPEMNVDLHGHNLATAYSLLDERLDRAISQGIRMVLLITGKPPQGEPPIARGRIRAAVGDWLAASRHAGDIAAVRGAHPRHGGAGALYIVLRRKK
ncbi:MAG: Smr/MutS family protein [Sphingosinicella sp.]|nr:Smr/MutS family protein [Sphingosinicella sp.]